MQISEAVNAVRGAQKTGEPLGYADFEKQNGTAGQESVIATYQADEPIVLRPHEAARLAVTAHESFTSDGTAGNTETFSLSNNVVDTPTTDALILFEAGTRVQPDAVDFANNTFDYTDDGTSNALDVYYVAADPTQVEITKSAPGANGRIEQKVFQANTGLVHEQNQFRDPLTLDVGTPQSDKDPEALRPVVPKKWTVKVYANGPYAVTWNESTNGTRSENALLSVPAAQIHDRINGLSGAVKQAILEG